ncbi:MAG: menaquinone biosynthesis protein [Planctomycetes bacterium]|nr:menaquinone biosynthesis protein [Planctomycetota bacterium]
MVVPGDTLTQVARRPVRLGAVSFVNTLPLIDGLENLADLELHYAVPSTLLDTLLDDEVDLALCSSIDYQRSRTPLVIVPCGLLGCDGPTLTVRLYCTGPIDRVTEVHCDTDSHTSVALLQILLRELHGIAPELVAFDARPRGPHDPPRDWPPALLLIGDKVVTDSPPSARYPHQLDLGAAWVELTGLPFVFALWLARRDADPAVVAVAANVLDRQRRYNRERLDLIIERKARPRGWPVALAASYLKGKLAFEFTDARRRGLELFFDKACEHGLVDGRRPLEIVNLS